MKRITDALNGLKQLIFPSEAICRILDAALQAADPFLTVERNLACTDSQLTVGSKTYPLYPDSRILMVAIGKASLAMSEAVQQKLGGKLFKGVVVCKHIPEGQKRIEQTEILQGSHPVPDERSVNAGMKIREMLKGLNQNDLVILLISGGGSALVCLPAPGISLEDMQSVTNGLLKSGASINELNAVRKHLDLIKGGGLLKMASPARVAALVISDVVNNPLDVIASGPAVPDPSTFQDAYSVLLKYLPKSNIPSSILERMELGCAGDLEETLKPGDLKASEAIHTLIACNQISAQMACDEGLKAGFDAEVITCELVGEARPAGEHLADILHGKRITDLPWLGIAGGETTVKVIGGGLGGRNLEVALGAVRKMSGMQDSLLITLATDGEDGPTNAAGAFVTGETLTRAQELGLDPEMFLANNDAYHFFEKVGGLIVTGPSGTNVNDLNFLCKY